MLRIRHIGFDGTTGCVGVEIVIEWTGSSTGSRAVPVEGKNKYGRFAGPCLIPEIQLEPTLRLALFKRLRLETSKAKKSNHKPTK